MAIFQYNLKPSAFDIRDTHLPAKTRNCFPRQSQQQNWSDEISIAR